MYSDFDLIKKKIFFNIDYNKKCSDGEIEFLDADEYIVYTSWKVIQDGIRIAGRSGRIYAEKKKRTNEAVIEKILEQISSYRIGRKQIFSNLQIKKSEVSI